MIGIFLLLASNSLIAPNLHRLTAGMTLVDTLRLPPIGVTRKLNGKDVPYAMSGVIHQTYTSPVAFDDVVGRADGLLKRSGWTRVGDKYAGKDTATFTYNFPMYDHPKPWQLPKGPFAYVMVVIRPGRAVQVRNGKSTEILPERRPWTTIQVMDDGHPLTAEEIKRGDIPWPTKLVQPKTGVVVMPAPRRPGAAPSGWPP